ncbi:MAG: hypothetical protein FIB07_09855 [Candidatus Methanoperedens sp.]|nr:hypothetical protein [Candidatus Methanoperedens sp.]
MYTELRYIPGESVKYIELVGLYEAIGATTKRLEITRYIVDFLKKTPGRVIDKIVYLTQGKLYPDFAGVDMGIAEKTALKALSAATGLSLEKVEGELRSRGDVGTAAERLLVTNRQVTLSEKELMVQDVYDALDKIARTTGAGSVDAKVKALSGLLMDAKPVEAKYIMRTVTGKMRLGIADMTILEALAQAYAGKECYNRRRKYGNAGRY